MISSAHTYIVFSPAAALFLFTINMTTLPKHARGSGAYVTGGECWRSRLATGFLGFVAGCTAFQVFVSRPRPYPRVVSADDLQPGRQLFKNTH